MINELNLYRALSQNPDWIPILREALEVEEQGQAELGSSYLGFEWWMVHASPQTLNTMVTQRILDITFSSRSSTHYAIHDREAVMGAIEAIGEKEEPVTEMPRDLFKLIVGHTDIKNILNLSIAAPMPVHVLLVGPPSTAKSMFLDELTRLPNARFALGGTSSKAGIAEFLLMFRPKYLVLDEIDKMDIKECSVLLSLMESGKVARLKKRMTEEEQMQTWVFSGANDIRPLPHALKSRFLVKHLRDYTEDEFLQVVLSVLTEREGKDKELAAYIATQLRPLTKDVRDAVKVARLAKTQEEVDQLIKAIWGAY